MVRYEFLDHTADVKFLAYGSTFAEAVESVVLATTAVMTDVEKIAPSSQHTVEVTGNRRETLLYELVDEMLYLLDTEGFLVSSIEQLEISEGETHKLRVTLLGDCADKYEVFTAIKAPTYSDMFIKEEPGKVTIQMVHDI